MNEPQSADTACKLFSKLRRDLVAISKSRPGSIADEQGLFTLDLSSIVITVPNFLHTTRKVNRLYSVA
jgi:hypothetical protein